MIGALVAVAAAAAPAVLVDCADLGPALALVAASSSGGGGGAAVSVAERGGRTAVPQGRWILRFVAQDLGVLDVRPDTVLIVFFEDGAGLNLAEWTGLDAADPRLCKRQRRGELPVPVAVLVTHPLSAERG